MTYKQTDKQDLTLAMSVPIGGNHKSWLVLILIKEIPKNGIS